jgi:hypothetical protein
MPAQTPSRSTPPHSGQDSAPRTAFRGVWGVGRFRSLLAGRGDDGGCGAVRGPRRICYDREPPGRPGGLRAAARGPATRRLRRAARQPLPGLVDLFRHEGLAGNPADLLDRAFLVEQAVPDAVDALDAPADEAMRIMLCLAPRTRRTSKQHRRRLAADLMDMTAGNFRRPHVEGALCFDLAVEIYRRAS